MGAGTLAGCSALGGPEFEKASDPFKNVQRTQNGNTKIGTGLAILPKGGYADISVKLASEGEIRFSGQVVQNPPMDFYVMTIEQYNTFQREPNLIQSRLESLGTTAPQMSGTFEQGQYLLVLDNTYLGEAKPSGEARMNFRFELEASGSAGTPTPTPSN